jgi:hypothetical protein
MTVGAFAVEYDPRFTFKHETSFYLIFLAGLSLNCMAGVQQEALFKRAMHTSIHVQNTFVYLFMLLSNLVTYFVLGSWQRDTTLVDADASLWAGFTWIVLAICIGEAVAGLSMSYVSKVYSSISKVFASSFNMALVSVTSTLLFGTPTTFIHVCGIAMITAALYYYQRDATLHSDAKSVLQPARRRAVAAAVARMSRLKQMVATKAKIPSERFCGLKSADRPRCALEIPISRNLWSEDCMGEWFKPFGLGDWSL